MMVNPVRWGLFLALGSTAVWSGSQLWTRATSPALEPSTPVTNTAGLAERRAEDKIAPPARPLSPAVVDPFEVPVAPVPVANPVPVAPPPPPPPPPPPMNWRYFGQMTSPDNKHQVFLSRGDQPIVVEAGQVLDDGFVVEAITTENVRLLHAGSGFHYLISLPEPPATDTH